MVRSTRRYRARFCGVVLLSECFAEIDPALPRTVPWCSHQLRERFAKIDPALPRTVPWCGPIEYPGESLLYFTGQRPFW